MILRLPQSKKPNVIISCLHKNVPALVCMPAANSRPKFSCFARSGWDVISWIPRKCLWYLLWPALPSQNQQHSLFVDIRRSKRIIDYLNDSLAEHNMTLQTLWLVDFNAPNIIESYKCKNQLLLYKPWQNYDIQQGFPFGSWMGMGWMGGCSQP